MGTDVDHSSSSSYSSSSSSSSSSSFFSSSSSSCYHLDDDFIDMEVSSSFCYSPQNREFEFQMSSICNDKDAAAFPADELFYKGKLLPLHLPPRLQMVQKLLQNPTATNNNNTTTNTFYSKNETFQENYSIPFINFPTTTTQLESCNISPSESCRVSCELINPDDYFFELSTEINNNFIGYQTPTKKSWTKKLKQSLLLGKKLKASSAYFKSFLFFNKSGCRNESCAKAESEIISKDNDNNKYMKVAKKNSSFANTLMKSIEKEMGNSEIFHSQRRSFSGAIQRHSTTNYRSLLSSSSGSSSSSSSFSFSSSSNGFCDLQLLKRSNSADSDIESSIEGAIAHCKKSHQQLFCSAKVTATEVV